MIVAQRGMEGKMAKKRCFYKITILQKHAKKETFAGIEQPPLVRQDDILNNKRGGVMPKGIPNKRIHQSSRSRLQRRPYRTDLAIGRPPECMKFRDMAGYKAGNLSIGKKVRKDFVREVSGRV